MAKKVHAPAALDAPPRLPLRGRPLSDEEFRAKVSTTSWAPALEYEWDAGIAISRFLEGMREGKIYGVRCHTCGRTVTPPRAFCERDFKPMDEWIELADTGTVNTFSICYVSWDMRPLRRPQIPAVIEIDGTHPRVGFLHLLGGLPGASLDAIRAQVHVGMRVRAVWKKPRDRQGSITDILYFAPIRKKARGGEQWTAMRHSITHLGEARVWRGRMPVEFLYTAGAAGERFFRTLQQRGVFAVTRCEECQITYLPPRLYCERCFADLSRAWKEIPPTGHVHTYTVVHVDRRGRPRPAPEAIAFVRIDGSDGGLVSRLLNVHASDIRLEMPVEAVLAPPRRRRGIPADILGFAPRVSPSGKRHG